MRYKTIILAILLVACIFGQANAQSFEISEGRLSTQEAPAKTDTNTDTNTTPAVQEYYDFSWHNLLLHAMKSDFSLDYGSYAVSYLKRYEPQTWAQYENNEFERDTRIAKAKEDLTWKISGFDGNKPYSMMLNVVFGKYDFERQRFVFAPFKKGMFLAVKEPNSFKFPNQIQVYFSNTDAIDGLPMKEDDAKKLLGILRDDKGNINRVLWGKLIFSVTSLRSDKFKAPITQLNARINKLILSTDSLGKNTVATFDLEG
ncbi:MAG: hypothetical protein K0R63_78 [Rickettsiales bacterium]|jgi:hypothetical protein|nr:hypothetical protein [Rickettsiales bacterium]